MEIQHRWLNLYNGVGQFDLVRKKSSDSQRSRNIPIEKVETFSCSILNIDFDFVHTIGGHVFRITRVPDNINKYELRIDNQDFEEMMQKYRAKVNADTSVIVKVKPGKTKRSKEIVQSSDQMYDMLRMLK